MNVKVWESNSLKIPQEWMMWRKIERRSCNVTLTYSSPAQIIGKSVVGYLYSSLWLSGRREPEHAWISQAYTLSIFLAHPNLCRDELSWSFGWNNILQSKEKGCKLWEVLCPPYSSPHWIVMVITEKAQRNDYVITQEIQTVCWNDLPLSLKTRSFSLDEHRKLTANFHTDTCLQ